MPTARHTSIHIEGMTETFSLGEAVRQRPKAAVAFSDKPSQKAQLSKIASAAA